MIGGVEGGRCITGGLGGHAQADLLNLIAQRDLAVPRKAAQSIGQEQP